MVTASPGDFSLHLRNKNLYFIWIPSLFVCTWKFEKHWFKQTIISPRGLGVLSPGAKQSQGSIVQKKENEDCKSN